MLSPPGSDGFAARFWWRAVRVTFRECTASVGKRKALLFSPPHEPDFRSWSRRQGETFWLEKILSIYFKKNVDNLYF